MTASANTNTACQQPEAEDLLRLAAAWRAEHGYTGRGGVVVLDGREACGWLNELRDPGHWIPGCIAIDEYGHIWEARWGDDSGASRWEPIITPRSEQVAESAAGDLRVEMEALCGEAAREIGRLRDRIAILEETLNNIHGLAEYQAHYSDAWRRAAAMIDEALRG